MQQCIRRVASLAFALAAALAVVPWTTAAAQTAPVPLPSPAANASVQPETPLPSASVSPALPPGAASPAPSASAPASLPPSLSLPSPTATPSMAPLSLSKTRLASNLGGTSATQILGGLPPYAVRLSTPIADAAIDPATGTLSLRALANGAATLSVTDAAGASVTASLLVAPSAGFVPADLAVSLIGNPTADYVKEQIRAALVRASKPFPGVRLTLGDAPVADLHPGERLDTPVRVHLDGANRYVDVDGIANVHVVTDAAAPIVPLDLFYSDDPEKIRTDGVLLRATISVARPARLYYYHQAATAGHEIAIMLESPTGGATVQIVGGGAGPNPAVMFVGQSATFRYLDAHARGSGVTLDVPVGAPVEVFTGDRPLVAGDLVAGILDFSVVAGEPVRLTVLSLSEGADLRALLASAELPTDGKNRRGAYDLSATAPLALGFRAGDPDPAPITVGGRQAALPNQRTGGQPLAGDYGLLRPLDLQLSNPGSVAATVYLYEQPIGYPVTTTIAFDGDPAPLRLQCVKTATNRYLVRAFTLPAGAQERVTGNYMTDGGSTYPLAFGLTATEPLAPPATMTAPDGCFPKPVPSPSASPASPIPTASPPQN